MLVFKVAVETQIKNIRLFKLHNASMNPSETNRRPVGLHNYQSLRLRLSTNQYVPDAKHAE